jgi:SAM-dependent methyltransferase
VGFLFLCCGFGRHAIALAERGYQVTGLDREAAATAEAERRSQAAGVEVTYVTGDMREIGELRDTFDSVINMWQSLSYFDDDTNADVLRAIHDLLTPGGRFIVDLYNRASFERQQGTKQQEINGFTVESCGYMQGDRWHSELTYRDTEGTIAGGDHLEWRLYTPQEFDSLATACGFTTRLACAWWDDGLAPSPEIGRMQIVLERS